LGYVDRMRSVRALIAALVVCLATVSSTLGAKKPPVVILVSLDGFRWDYLDLVETPHLNRLAEGGVRAEGLIPVYPSKTFPSHYSIVTGLYPGNHGIISNNMYDSGMDAEFHLDDRTAVEDSRWWGGEPIWVTAESQGVQSATLFWPGSETEIGGFRPTDWRPYDESMTFESRVDQVLEWLDRGKKRRPQLITLYFEYPNDVSHVYGPEAPESFASIREVDARIGDLLTGIGRRRLAKSVNLIIVSDHGMAEVGPERVVILEDFVDLQDGEVFEDGTILQIYPQEGRLDLIYEALRGADPHLAIYKREEIPERYHLREGVRTPPLLGVPDVGWEISASRDLSTHRATALKGDHGQDPADPRMHGLFIAHGPAFRSGLVIDRIESIHLYNLMAAVLGLEPAPNDGQPEILRQILVNQ